MLEIIITMMAGCGAFLLGFKVLGDNMEKIAGNSLRRLFNKTSDKRMINVGMGAAATAVIQSSAVTTVMVVGFVNAGIMSLTQAAALIMGANIGTTITGQIAALQVFDVDLIFMAMLFVGVFMDLFSKNEKVKCTGLAFAGLGLIFVGLGLVSDPMKSLAQSPEVMSFLQSIHNPILLLFIGIAFTAIIQSSSAVTTIVISMAGAGLMIGGGGNSALFIILGSNIGTCVTAMISSIGTSVNARRASIIHLLFNVLGTVIFVIMLLCWPTFNEMTLEKWFANPATQIAMFHTFFNVTATFIFIPFIGVLVKLAMKLVPEKQSKEKDLSEFVYMDKRFLSTPAVALEQLKKESFRMADMAMQSLQTGFDSFVNKDVTGLETVTKLNTAISKLSENISEYLVRVSASDTTFAAEKEVNALHTNIGDIARIAEIADNFIKYTRREVNEDLSFSEGINEKLAQMQDKLQQQYLLVKDIVLNGEMDKRAQSDAVEDEIDGMRRDLVAEHIARLAQGKCRPENNTVFINLVSNLERAGDHLNYIVYNGEN
jgi:phosphate:Na+ symporter